MAATPDQQVQMQTLHTEIYDLEIQALELQAIASEKSRILKRIKYEAYGTGMIYGEVESC